MSFNFDFSVAQPFLDSLYTLGFFFFFNMFAQKKKKKIQTNNIYFIKYNFNQLNYLLNKPAYLIL